MKDYRLAGVVGSYRTYLDDQTQIFRGKQGIYIQTHEWLNQDDWDYKGGWMAEPYNWFAREPGKTVMMKYEGEAYIREFFIPYRSPRVFEVPRDRPLPTHARETIEAGRNAVKLSRSKKSPAKPRRTSSPVGNWR